MSGDRQDRGAEAAAAELDDAARAAMALIRARHDGRDADMAAILATMSHGELLALVLTLTGMAREGIVRMCAVRCLADEAIVAEVLSVPVDEMNPEGLAIASEMLAEVHRHMTGA